jgi:hypothetical protein
MLCASLVLVACGGGTVSVLHAKGKPSGEGDAQLVVLNSSGETIEKLFIAKTEAVDRAKEAGASPDSDADKALWGDDQLGNAGLGEGSKFKGLHLAADHYDILLVAHDHREQLVEHLDLKSGGRYLLEVKDAWAMGR